MKIKIIILNTLFMSSLVAMELPPATPSSKTTSINYPQTTLTMLIVHHIAQQFACALLGEKARVFLKPLSFLDIKAKNPQEVLKKEWLKISSYPPELCNKIVLALSLHILISKASEVEKTNLLATLMSIDKHSHSQFIALLINKLLPHTPIKEITDTFALEESMKYAPPTQPPFLPDQLALIHLASMLNDNTALQCLLSFNSTAQDKTSLLEDTPYHYAAQKKYNATLLTLINTSMPTQANKQGVYPLSQALISQNREAALLLMNLPEFKENKALAYNALEQLLLHGSNYEIAQLFLQKLKDTPFYQTLEPYLQFYLAIAAHDNELFAYPSSPLYIFAHKHINFRDFHSKLCPLHIAAAFNNQKAAEFLLTYGACLETEVTQHFFSLVYQATPLLIAARKGYLKIVKYFLMQRKAKLCSSCGISALHCASMSKNLKLVDFLLNHNKELKDITYQGTTPLHIAVFTEDEPLVRLLVDKGFDKEAIGHDNLTPLALAFQFNEYPAIAHFLLEQGVVVPQLIFQESPLYRAIALGWLNIVKFLIAQGISVDKVNAQGLTPLEIAAQCNHKEIFEFLQIHDRYTDPLQNALENEDIKILSFLLNHSFYRQDSNPLCKAITLGKQVITKILFDNYPNLIALCDELGNTPLHTAVLSKNYEIIKYLSKQNSALLSKLNKDGHTSLDVACALSDTESITLLSNRDTQT